ncbi:MULTISPECIES: sigma-54 interaction domain-containing protein [Halomonas]|uniref:sigma-54 interaction domain-containing protein n=1 Tax=Halomonas TaxID=2745 RepID=UPI001C96D685|nr:MULTISPECIES: sigma 54-interacting transcriptional regulator [Halomonas]MBY6208129.1 sigma 54-interacting transcriptional regulator [Halomonas sp. DP3Y7-2]MBY6228938.1 sigma 54-interacting transcriptional regulator [Halomonas sp. DP3Y7-1]MCA0917078.1 sigma 54-interacting transcriptional regulator [Halomonas denitrificans]
MNHGTLMPDQLLAILNALEDGIFITDLEGRVLWVNQASLSQLETTEARLYASDVYTLEQEGVFSPSVTRFVIDERRPVSVVHRYRGKDYLVNGSLFCLNSGSPAEPDAVLVQTRNLDRDVLASRSPDTTQALLDHVMHQLKRIRQEQVASETSPASPSRSPRYRQCLERLDRAAASDTTVLVTGETGVGKSWLVNRLHQYSPRSDKPLIHVNCAAIPEALLEAELFGHRSGAFTGAHRDGRVGYVALAEGGTLFLDEIGELPLPLQPKLLQLLQERQYHPLGGKVQKANVRIVAATNADLATRVQDGSFRPDLFYRLNIVPIEVPPLRERPEDIPRLATQLLKDIAQRHKRHLSLERAALRALSRYHWPGNVRELENLLERMSVFCEGSTIGVADLALDLPELKPSTAADATTSHGTLLATLEDSDPQPLPERLAALERAAIDQALEQHGSTRKAAEALGVSQSWLMRRLRKG